MLHRRNLLLRGLKYFSVVIAIAILFVLADFTVDLRPPNIRSSYRFTLDEIPVDQPVWLRQDNLTILLIRRSSGLLGELSQQTEYLQDPNSESSRQPELARNRLRSLHRQYFIAYARGTDLGCPLEPGVGFRLRESCSTATYDYAGRAISGDSQFLNLSIPDYTFNHDFKILTVSP